MLSGVHSQRDVTISLSAPGIPCQKSRSDLVVSHHLAGFLRRALLWSAADPEVLRVAGLLHPAANRGVHRVSALRVLLPGRTALPRDVSYPSKDSTHLQPYRVTTACCPLDVSSPRCSRLQGSRCRIRPSARLPPRARLQGFALRMSPYHHTPFPTPDGLSSRGLLCPLQDPSSAIHLLASMSRDERPVRLRGSVSVPIVPAPASATAAPLSGLEPVRGRVRGYASLRCPPRRRDPARSRADAHSKRRTHGASRASRTSRFITDAGRSWHPLQGACRVDVTIAFD